MPTAPDATPFALACDQIAADVVALTPAYDTGVAYVRSVGEDVDYGASGHRSFWFEFVGRETMGQRGSAFHLVEVAFQFKMRVHAASATVRSLPNNLNSEAQRIRDEINARESYAAGIRTIRALRESVLYEGRDAILVIHCVASLEEVRVP